MPPVVLQEHFQGQVVVVAKEALGFQQSLARVVSHPGSVVVILLVMVVVKEALGFQQSLAWVVFHPESVVVALVVVVVYHSQREEAVLVSFQLLVGLPECVRLMSPGLWSCPLETRVYLGLVA